MVPLSRIALAASLVAAVAFADDTARARDAFVKAQGLYAAGKYQDALVKFEASLAAKPHPSTVFNIARCQDQLGDLVRAMTSYKEYLRQSPKANDADEVVKAMASIEGRLQAQGKQHLLVYVEPATARVWVDGKELGASPAASILPPGSHELSITAPGYETYQRSFPMSASRSTEFSIALNKAAAPAANVEPNGDAPMAVSLTPPPTPPASLDLSSVPQPRRRLFTWVAAGTAGVATGVGVAFSLMMKNNETALNTLTPERTRDQATGLYNDAFTFGTVATISFITAGVAAAAAALLFFLEGA